MSIIYMFKLEMLSLQEAAEIIRSPDISKISTLPACDPKCGQLFLYSFEGSKHKKDDWRCDQFRWIQKGRHLLPKKQPFIQKLYFQRLINRERVKFYRYAYQLPDGSMDRVIVHYLGKDDGSQPSVLHRIPKRNLRKRTMPLVLREAAEQKYDSPSKHYQKKIAMSITSPGYVKVMVPKDVQQIKNKLKYEQKKTIISRADFYAVRDLHRALGEFVCQFSLVPEIYVILALQEIVGIFEEMAAQNQITLLSYDTAFQLGDFHVSPLVFQCSFFEEKPAIPLAVLIHDKRSGSVHESFFKSMGNRVPQMNSDSMVIVTDSEAAILQGIQKGIPHCTHILCWDHIIKDVEFWVSEHGGRQADGKVYSNDILELLGCESEKEFLELFEKLKVRWSANFLGYFEQKLQTEIVTKSGRWLLEKRGIYKETRGITISVSENMNAVFRRLRSKKDHKMDSMIRAFYFLQNFYLEEILKGLCDIGSYHLLMEFAGKHLNPDAIQFSKDCVPPDEIVNAIKQGLTQRDQKSETQRVERKSRAKEGLAHLILRQNNVFLQAQSGCFIVKELLDKIYVVTLFPTETCSCGSRTCHHIMAAQISIGKNPHPKIVMDFSKKFRMSARKGKPARKKPSQKDELLTVVDSLHVYSHVIPKEEVVNDNKVAGKDCESSSLALDLEQQAPSFPSTLQKANPDVQRNQSVPWDSVKGYPHMTSMYIQRVFINADDMKTLLDNNWLVDTVIESFLLTRTTLATVATTDLSVHVFSPFIMRTLELHGYATNVHDFGINADVMSKDIWLVPTNVQNAHWILMMVFLKWKIILYLDSNRGLSTNYTDMLQTFMEKQTPSPINWSEWIIHAPVDIPLQKDSFNCGVFVCLFAHVLCSGAAVPFPVDMAPVRQWIATELLKQKSFIQQSSFTQGKRKRMEAVINQEVQRDFKTPVSRGTPRGSSSTVEFLASVIQQYYSSS